MYIAIFTEGDMKKFLVTCAIIVGLAAAGLDVDIVDSYLLRLAGVLGS